MIIAVLLATYNRQQKTLACLKSLSCQLLPHGVIVETYLTDSGSTDGTSEAVKQLYTKAKIFNRDNNLFWAGGMRNSWKHAIEDEPDFYLLLNDDTILAPNAIATLIDHKDYKSAVTIGSTQDPSTHLRSYGGRKLTSKYSWKDDLVVFSQTEYLPCDVANANIMLVPKMVVEKIGMLTDVFTHGLADYDYSLRANKAGFKVIVAPGFLGTCENDHGKNWRTKIGLKKRIQYLKSPKGLAYREYMFFIRSHFPLSYPAAFVKIWMKTLFPSIWEVFKK